MNSFKVFYLITDLSTGGAQTTLLRLIKGLDQNLYEPTVICLNNGKSIIAQEIKNNNIPLYDLGMANKSRIVSLYNLNKLLHRKKPQILHSWLFHANVSARLFGRMSKVPVIITSRRNINIGGNRRELLKRLTLGLDDKVIAVSEAAREAEIERTGIPSQKVVTIYNGVDLTQFPEASKEKTKALRDLFGIQDNELLVGAIGRFEAQKGFGDLVTSFSQIDIIHKTKKLLIVGEGSLRKPLEAQVKSFNLSDQIIFAGLKNNIPEILSAIDVFVSPSLWEGLPNVILEAMAAGKPVVATSVGGTPEVVKDKLTGLLVPPGNPDALANAISRLLKNPDLRSKMGDAGQERVKKYFSIQSMVDKTQQLYHDLLIEKGIF